MVFPNFVLNKKTRNQWFLCKDGDIFKFEFARKDKFRNVVCARQIVNRKEFYNLPISSVSFDIYLSDGTVSDLVFKYKSSKKLNENIVFAPLRHAE